MSKRMHCMAIGIIVITVSSVQAEDLPRFPICTAAGNQYSPAVDGTTVVWGDTQNGTYKLKSHNLLTGQENTLATGILAEHSISNNIVVWKDNTGNNNSQAVTPGIYGYNLDSRTTFSLATSRGIYQPEYSSPIISGNNVAWTVYPPAFGGYGGHGIAIHDLLTGNDDYIQGGYAGRFAKSIWGNTLISAYPSSSGESSIYVYDLVSHSEHFLPVVPINLRTTAISNSIVAWDAMGNNGVIGGNGLDIFGYDLSSNAEFPICTAPGDQFDPKINGDIVVWQDYRNGKADIYAYNLRTHTEFEVCTLPNDKSLPSISGNTVVWSQNDNGDWNVYGATVPEPATILLFTTALFMFKNKRQPQVHK